PLPKTQLRKLAKSRPTDIPTVCKSVHGPWSMSVDQDPIYPASDANDGRSTRIVVRSTFHRSDRSESLSERLDLRPQSTDRRLNYGP
ncbi:hypothetical protein MTR67_038366, partial [Solanum verrucosum]